PAVCGRHPLRKGQSCRLAIARELTQSLLLPRREDPQVRTPLRIGLRKQNATTMEPTIASHSTSGAVSGISRPDDLCVGTGSCIYSYCEKKLRQLCAARRTLLKKSASVVFRSQNGREHAALVSGLLHELVELDLRLRPFQPARVPHDLLVGVAAAIGLDRGLAIPFRVRDEFGSVSAAQELFRNAALLPDHERSAFRLPDPCGVFGLGRIDLDVDEADGHGVLLARSR